MKKSSVVLFLAFALASGFLLWLWFYLGFNRVDDSLDLALSIAWWLVIIIVYIVILRLEKIRRKRVRTIYISEELAFNSELGSLPYNGPIEMILLIEKILNDLKYSFSKVESPNTNAFPIKFIVRTFEHNDDVWKGEVTRVEAKNSIAFESKEQLFQILNGIQK